MCVFICRRWSYAIGGIIVTGKQELIRERFFFFSSRHERGAKKNFESPSGIEPSDSTLRWSTTEPQRLHGERCLLRSSYDTRSADCQDQQCRQRNQFNEKALVDTVGLKSADLKDKFQFQSFAALRTAQMQGKAANCRVLLRMIGRLKCLATGLDASYHFFLRCDGVLGFGH